MSGFCVKFAVCEWLYHGKIGGIKMLWMCENCGNLFTWVRKGVETKPKCPNCGSKNVDAVEG